MFDKLILASVDIIQMSAKFQILVKTTKKGLGFLNCVHIKTRYMYVISSKSVICMELLIPRPSVLVWGPEASLSTVFVKRRAIYERKPYLR